MYVKTQGKAGLHLQDMSFNGNDANGLVVDGNSCCHIEDVAFTHNGGDGMHILGMMTNVDAYGTTTGYNGGNGIYVASGGFVSTQLRCGMVLDNVRAFSNGNNGVYVCGCLVQLRELTARDNGGHGVLGMLTDVDAYSGLSDNDAGGIKVDGRCNLCQWTAAGNTGNGIEVGSGSTVRSCTACGNTGDGILVSSNCRVIDNTCESNIVAGEFGAVAGIHATGSGNRIEDNHVIGNNIGIDVDSTGNLIIKNSAQGNGTNYDIASGNTAGPTLGTGDIVSDNPHANYEF